LQVSFYSDAVEPLQFACRLLRRARASGKSVGVCGPLSELRRLDALLWSFDPTEFIAHRIGVPSQPGELGLVESAATLGHREVLLNLGPELPDAAAEFERILEVIGLVPEQVQQGRRRYRAYLGLGATLEHFAASG
jgi:DNA polymerase III subunit chi